MRLSIIVAAHNEGVLLEQTLGSVVESAQGLEYELLIADAPDDVKESAQRDSGPSLMMNFDQAPVSTTYAPKAVPDSFESMADDTVILMRWSPKGQTIRFGGRAFRHRGAISTDPSHDLAHLLIAANGGLDWAPRIRRLRVLAAEFRDTHTSETGSTFCSFYRLNPFRQCLGGVGASLPAHPTGLARQQN